VSAEAEEALGFLTRFLRQLGDDLLGDVLVDRLEDVGAVVRRHLRDERGRLLGGDGLQELRPQLLVQVLEDVGGARRWERREERPHLVPREELSDVGQIGRMHLLGLGGNRSRRLVQQVEDVRRYERSEGLFVQVHGDAKTDR
jgi:hypothetical protein